MYDGYKPAGFEHDQIVKLCNSMAPKEYQGVTSVLPEVTGKLQTRKSQKGNCIEEWTVK